MAARTTKKKLSEQHALFVEHYAVSLNATDAARKAGYSPEGARVQGSRLLTNVNILEAIEERLAGVRMGTNEWFARMNGQARGDLGELLNDDGSINLDKAREEGLLHLVSEYQVEQSTRRDEKGDPYQSTKTKLKLHSSQRALQILGERIAIPAHKLELVETQIELAQHKLEELRKEEALLALLKNKAPKEVFEEVVRVLAGGPATPGKGDAVSKVKLEWSDARSTDQPGDDSDRGA